MLWTRRAAALCLSLFPFQIRMFIKVILYYFNQCILDCEEKLSYILNSYASRSKGAIFKPYIQPAAYYSDIFVYETYVSLDENLGLSPLGRVKVYFAHNNKKQLTIFQTSITCCHYYFIGE